MQHTKSELMKIGANTTKDVIANIVFVHGLGGHNRETWQCKKGDDSTFWPQWLYDDLNAPDGSTLPPVGVWSLGYPAEVFQVLFFSKARDDSVPQRARNLVDMLLGHRLADRPIIFIAHSLGGVLVKQMLRSSADAGNPRYKPFSRLAHSTRLVIFLATPHTGSSMARLAETVPAVCSLLLSGLVSTVEWLPLSAPIRLLARRAVKRGKFTKALESGDPYLEDLGAWYRNNAPDLGIETRSYYENTRERGVAIVVDKESANPGVSGTEAIALDASHGSICKPENRNDNYRRIADPVGQVIREYPVFRETHLSVLDAGERFTGLAELLPAERLRAVKKVVHPIEVLLGRDPGDVEYKSSIGGTTSFEPALWQQQMAQASRYDLDRIILNVWREHRGGIPASGFARSVCQEAERLKTGPQEKEKVTLIPLYYAARALRRQRRNVQLANDDKTDLQQALDTVKRLANNLGVDEDKKTQNVLQELLQ